MRSRNIILKGLLCILLPVLGSVQAWGGNTTYYGRGTATVSSVSPTGSGTVYVSTTNSGSGTYDANTSSATGEADGQNSATVTVYAFAKANENYEFVGWNTQNGTTATTSTDNPKTISGSANSTDKNNPTNIGTLYAIFAAKPVFYFSATAVATPAGGGTASVSPATTNVRGEHWDSTSATTTATFTATANSGYEFAGWYSDAGLTTQVSTSTTYQATITSTSTNSGNPKNTTLYARFEPIPTFYFSASAVVTPSGAGTASASPSTAHVNGEHWNSTSATTNVTFSAEPNSSFLFLGWSESANGTIVSTDNPYNRNITSTSTNSSSPKNTTLYARFQPYATSITASPSELTVYVGRSSEPITHTVSPSGAYDEHTTYESANTAIATVDANGRVTGVATGTTTITVKSLKNDNSTVAASTPVSVTVKNKVATPVITFSPDPNDESKTVATITCATTQPTPTIRYTINDSAPTTTTGQVYDSSTKFNVNDNDVVRAIAFIPDADDPNDLWDKSDVATETYSSCTTDKPVITFVPNSGTGKATVTITAETGATIYYTTDGSTPKPTSYTDYGTTPVSIPNVDCGTTVKAIAKNSSCKASAPESMDIVFTYVSGGKVVLEDREDHNWSYYHDPDCPIRSLSPADVTITYNGNGIMMIGNGDYTANSVLNTDYIIKSTGNNYNGSAKVGIAEGEDQSIFEYHKTLERGDATQNTWTYSSANQSSAASRCPYTTIPNPFQVRPTYGTTGDTRWRGFQCWRLVSVSGGSIYSGASGGSALSTGAVINADTKIYFAPNAETGMSVVLEAVWARAYVTTSNNNDNDLNSSVSYERNFRVITSTSNLIPRQSNGYQYTLSSVYPNGTSDGDNTTTTKGSTTIRGGDQVRNYVVINNNYQQNYYYRPINLSNNLKLEYVTFNGNGESQNNTNRTIVTANNHDFIVGRGVTGPLYQVRGFIASNTAQGIVNNKIRLESGNYIDFYCLDQGTEYIRNGNNYNAFTTYNSTVSVKAILGCDYDRANGANTLLKIAESSGNMYGSERSYFNSENNKDNLTFDWTVKSGTFHGERVSDAGADYCIYMGSGTSYYYLGKRRITIEGGIISNIAGSLNGTDGSNNASYDNNYTTQTEKDVVLVRVKGGTIRGSIYGAAAFAGAAGGRTIIATKGTINGWIAGGCNGTRDTGGELFGSTYLYIGGNSNVVQSTTDPYIGGTSSYGTNGAYGGNIFGAGCGIQPASYNQNDPSASLKNLSVGKVFGSTVVIADNSIIGRDVYGGGNFGLVADGTFGNNSDQTANIHILGGTVRGKVYGGSNNQHGQTVNITMKGGIVEKGIYGGSNTWGTINNNVTIHINGGQVGTPSVDGVIHGGGLGNETRVLGSINITLGASTTSTDFVTVYGDVYGGSAQGKTNGNNSLTSGAVTNVTLNKGDIRGSLYGGGLGNATYAADVYGPVTVTVNSGKAENVFGCNNSKGEPKSTVSVTVNGTDNVQDGNAVGSVFGGGNQAAYTSTPTVNMAGGIVGTIYGGGNEAGVAGGSISMTGGKVNQGIYGGCNSIGKVDGNITISLTGGTIGLANGKTDIVFGGGYGASTNTTGNVTVTVDGTTIHGNVYGGSALGSVNYENTDTATTTVHILSGTINGNIYGGGLGQAGSANAAKGQVNGTVIVNIGSGTVDNTGFATSTSGSATINDGSVYGCNNTNGSPKGNVTVNIYQTAHTEKNTATYTQNDATYAIDQVFGGGNQADYSPTGDKKATVHVYTCDNTIRRVFGGGNAAEALGVVTRIDGGRFDYIFGGGNGEVTEANIGTGGTNLTVNSGVINHLFGGSNAQGTITGTMGVTVNNTGCTEDIKEFFAGGNLAVIGTNQSPVNLNTTIACGTNFGTIYGGSNLADIYGNITMTINGGTISTVYAGSKGVAAGDATYPDGKAANIHGNTVLNIYGGDIGNAFGGSNINGNITGSITVNMDWSQAPSGCNSETDLHIDNIFGASNLATYTPTTPGNYPAVNIIHGTVSGSVFGAGNGDPNDAAKGVVTSNPKVTIGDTNANHSAVVNGNVYGGGNNAAVTGNTSVTYNDNNTSGYVAKLFGGGNAAGVSGTSTVTLTNGKVTAGVYGGCNAAGTVNGAVSVEINGGTVGSSTARANIHGGGYGQSTKTGNNVAVTVGPTGEGTGPTIYGDVYGGSALGSINSSAETPAVNSGCTTTVTMRKGNVYGDIYGGGLGQKNGVNNATSDIEAKVWSPVTVNLNGGTVSTYTVDETLYGGNVFGCNNLNGAPQSTVKVNFTNGNASNVFGGGNQAAYTGTPDVNISGGTIGNVFGGGNEAGVGGGDVAISGGTISSGVYGGCNTSGTVNGDITLSLTGGTVGVNGTTTDVVYGGGYGHGTSTTGDIGIALSGTGTTIYGNIYGGSALGSVGTSGKTTTITIDANTLHGTIFGGGMGSGTGDATKATTNGNVEINYNTANTSLTGLYGGANVNGSVAGNIEVKVNANVGASGSGNSINIFGGGLGANTNTEGNVTVNVGNANAASAAVCPTIYGDIYGGSALGTVNDAVADLTTVNINNGTINGNIYGGGLGAATLDANGYIASVTTKAIVNGTVHVNIGTSTQSSNFVTIDGQVFGCNNLAGSPKGHVYVDVYHTAHVAANTYPSPVPATPNDVAELSSTAFAIGAVYGGGNLAHYTTTTTGAKTNVHIHNCDNTIEYVYGGGKAASSPATDVVIDGGRFNYIFGGGNGAGTGNPGADINGNTAVTLNGGIIYRAFGGSNTKGVISGTSGVSIPEVTTCTRLIHEIFGGGNKAPGGSVDMTIPCGTTGTGIIYAGANMADMGNETDFNNGTRVLVKLTIEGGNFTQVFGGNNQDGTIWGDVELHLKGGTIGQAFGGNNQGGNVKGTIKVFVDDDESACSLVLTDVYGGGNEAAYTPALDANNATIESPQVYINHIKSSSKILGNVYGGGYGSGATVTANPKVVIGDLSTGTNKIASIAGDVYGGGNAASVVGTTTIIMQKANSSVDGALFGGGNAAGITGSTNVTLSAGTVSDGIYGGCNSAGNVSVATNVNIEGGTVGASNATADIFGSGKGHSTSVNEANVNIGKSTTDNENNTTYTGTANIYGDVYGGSEMGSAGTTTVNLYSAELLNGHVYGGGKGQVGNEPYSATVETATVNQYGITTFANNKNIYGACNVNGTADATYIYIKGGTSNEVFGGGNLADMTGDATVEMTGGSAILIYGGGSDADIIGNTTVTISSGNVTADVFGGGKGQTTTVTGDVTVNIGTSNQTGNGATITRDVYGGSALGAVNATKTTQNNQTTYSHTTNSKTTVNVYLGTVNGSVYGGGLGQVTGGDIVAHVYGKSTVNIGDATNTSAVPTIRGSVYGGSNANGVSEDDVEVNVIRGSVTGTTTTNNLTDGNVFGGGKGEPTLVKGSVTVNIGKETAANSGTYVGYAQVAGNVYGGSALGNVNAVNSGNTLTRYGSSTTAVNLNGGTVTGSVFGGGLGQRASGEGANAKPDILSNVYGPVTVTANGGKAANVFGCNDQNGEPKSTVAVVIHGTDAATELITNPIGNVYGGGNLASYSGSPTVTMDGGTVGNVYGGGYGASAIISGSTSVSISGGKVNNDVYGGGDAANVTQNVTVSISGGQIVNDVYGGGSLAHTNTDNWNAAGIADGTGTWASGKYNASTGETTYKTSVSLTGGVIGNAYGGAKGDEGNPAYVYGDVTVTLAGASLPANRYTTELDADNVPVDILEDGRVFGCNNIAGTPKGSVKVLVTSTSNVDPAKTAKPVNDNQGNPVHRPSYYNGGKIDVAAVYGGGNKADYEPVTNKAPEVIIDGCTAVSIGAVYGGGNAAAVPATSVEVDGAYYIEYVFGGGFGAGHDNRGANVGYKSYPLNNPPTTPDAKTPYLYGTETGVGNVYVNLLGGYIDNVFGGSDTKGDISGKTTVNASEISNGCDLMIGSWYGGGRKAPSYEDVISHIDCPSNNIQNVYGGAEMADIHANVILNIHAGTITTVFGGNKKRGQIDGTITVNIEETDKGCKPIIIGKLYGGGDDAPYSGNPNADGYNVIVNAKAFTSIGYLYGGSKGEPATLTGNTLVNINETKGHWAGKYYPEEIPNPNGSGNIPNSDPNDFIPNQLGTIGYVYGGGDRAKVIGNTVVNIGTATTVGFISEPHHLSGKYTLNATTGLYDTKVLGANITGNVFGGGDNADVTGNTEVYIGATKVGNTYNTVNVKENAGNDYQGVKILGSVYGGGNMGSVGTFTVNGAGTDDGVLDGKPESCTEGGTSTVVIMDYAEIGPDNMKMITESGMPDDAGHVFGAGKGSVLFSDIQDRYTTAQLDNLSPQQKLDELAKIAYVNNTEVIIGSYAFIKGSVYGGSENGHVLNNTHVTIQDNCQIGNGWDATNNQGVNCLYTDSEWNNETDLYECASWTYDANDPKPYDIYDYQTGTTKPKAATDGHTFYGNVFGGGSGYYPYARNPYYNDIDDYGYADGLWLRSAGIVEGNTVVDITGGHILTSVYGGNEQTDVLGSTTINMSAGTVGVPRTLAQMQAHPVTCYVFGGGKGDQRKNFNKWTNVGSANVNITGTARIYGSVFGGGEDGHVIRDAVTNIGSSQANADNSHILIGTTGTSAVDGNIFGGGRGFSGTSLTAGVVQGNITVNIYGGTMLGSVFGGGRLASVGTNLVHNEAGATEDSNGNVIAITDYSENPLYGTLIGDAQHGNITVNIYDGTIGATSGGTLVTSDFTIGDVFAGSKGNLDNPELGLANNTTLYISGGTINHNVYGGGEIASVGKITNFKQRDAKDNNDKYMYRHDFAPKANDGALYSFGLSWPYEFTYPSSGSGLATVSITGTTRIAGDVFGGSKGKVDVGENDITKQRFKEALYANVLTTDVTINLNATANSTDNNTSCIAGYVYGGSEDGHILDNTSVTISSGLIGGSVFGGGKGLGQYTTTLLDYTKNTPTLKSQEQIYSWTAGKVYGNTRVNMTGGHVMHNVYGGGYNGSVGKGNYAGGADDYYSNGYGELPLDNNANLWTLTEGLHDMAWHFLNSGKATVIVSGGTVGTESNAEADGFPYGNVFGSSRGKAAIAIPGQLSPRYRYIPEFYLGYANETEVEIGSDGSSNGPRIYGSVYGSGQDGHVRRDTKVTVYSGVIGNQYTNSADLTSKQWLHRGNIYGAGSGIGLDANNVQNYSSGSVTCATQVIIQGGTIYQNVYGGGALASVGPPKVPPQQYDESNAPTGSTKSYSYSKVTLNGGTIGTEAGYNAGYGGNVFGASRGSMPLNLNIADTRFATDLWTEVNISNGTVWGNVFGGGEAGEVKDGVTVNIVGGQIKHDVYGGGALANTNTGNWGTNDFNSSFLTTNLGKTTTRYNTKVSLLGGQVEGDVYGGGLGRLESTGVSAVEAMVYGDVLVNLNGFDVRDFGTVPQILAAKAPTSITPNGTEHMIADDATGAIVNRIFGANNLNGTPAGHIKVHVFATQNSDAGKNTISDKFAKQPVQGEGQYKGETLEEFLVRLANANAGNNSMLNAITAAQAARAAYEIALSNYNAAIAEGSSATQEEKQNLHDILEDAQTAASEAIAAIYDLMPGLYDVKAVYGGGNLAAYIYGNGERLESPEDSDSDAEKEQKNAKIAAARTEVIIDGCDFTSIEKVYGGGNAAPVPGTYVLVNSSWEINELFGGGNGDDNYSIDGVWYENPGANVGYENYTHYVTTGSPQGSGTQQDPYKAIDNDNADTKEHRIQYYSYGSGIATTDIRGGTIHSVFGGSDKKGNIRNSALSVYTESNDDCPITINETYGGGKDAPMDADIEFNMDCVTDMDIVYGGANNADSYSDIRLNITNGHINSVYGGNNIGGALYGSITINIEEKGCTPIVIDNLYGGGNLAPYSIYGYEKESVNGVYVFKHDETTGKLIPLETTSTYGNDPVTSNDPRINIISATHIGNVYGGGYKAKLVGSPIINVNMQQGKMEVYEKTTEGGIVYVDVNDKDKNTGYVTYQNDDNLTETYVEEGVTKTKYFTQLSLGNIENIYGGGFEADVVGDTYVEIGTGQWITGWNINGAIYEPTKNTNTNYSSQDRHDAVITGNVFGGGDNADVTGNTNVTIGSTGIRSGQKLLIEHNVYGGGNMGSVGTITKQTQHSDVANGFALSWPYEFEYKEGTGKATVNINGGRIGLSGKDSFGNLKLDDNGNLVYKADADGYLLGADGERIQLNNNYLTANDIANETTYNQVENLLQTINQREDNGDVYGGSKGNAGGLKDESAPDRYKEALIANVRETEVNIDLPTPTDADIEILASYDWEDEDFEDKMKYALKLKDGLYGIAGSVYGGGEDGHVYEDTHVTIDGGYIGHAVYGGGKGKGSYTTTLHKIEGNHENYDTEIVSITAGRVYGNTNITMTDGYVMRNIFGGGNLGSVGKGNYASGADDYYTAGYGEKINGNLWTTEAGSSATATRDNAWYFLNSGKTTVTVTGGKVGFLMSDNTPIGYTDYTPDDKQAQHGNIVSAKANNYKDLPKKISFKDDLPTGNVFGGSRGTSAPDVGPLSPRYEYAPEFYLGYVNETDVIIGGTSTGPTLLGSVYGGGQDGHVRRDTKVTVNNGEIGIAYNNTNRTLVGTLAQDANEQQAGDHTDFTNNQWLHRGNVYGAGSGIGKYSYQLDNDQALNPNLSATYTVNGKTYLIKETGNASSAGSVTHFTTVNVGSGINGTSGHIIYRNVYGGGSLSTVGPPKIAQNDDPYLPTDAQHSTEIGKQTLNQVNIEGTVGHADSYAVGYGGDVIGGSRGDATLDPNTFATSFFTEVNIKQGANVIGNVFGGGEAGLVKNDSYVNISGSIATTKLGNDVFGGGDQADVNGNTYVNITGGHILHNVYGGGRMGSVGTVTSKTLHNQDMASDYSHYEFGLSWPVEFQYADNTGKATVSISGNTRLGTNGDDNGDVFGGGMGDVTVNWSEILTRNDIDGSNDQEKIINYIKSHRSFDEAEIANVKETDVTINLPFTGTLDSHITPLYVNDNDGGKKYKLIIDATYNESTDTYTITDGIPCITGSVYGGSENGHVNGDTKLELVNGIVGHALYGGGKGKGQYQGILYDINAYNSNTPNTHTPKNYQTLNGYIANAADRYKEIVDNVLGENIYSITAGKVYGNTHVIMDNGYVLRNVFGGGNLGSVGKGNYAGGADDYSTDGYGERPDTGASDDKQAKLWDSSYDPEAQLTESNKPDFAWHFLNSGQTNIEIKGGQIGYILPNLSSSSLNQSDASNLAKKDDLPTGNVFGGSRGQASPSGRVSPRYMYIPDYFLGYVNQTNVIIGTTSGTAGSGPKILGSVYGGGQDGHVRRDAQVTVNNASIGLPFNENANTTILGDDKENLQWRGRGNVFGAGSGIGTYSAWEKNQSGQYNYVTDGLNFSSGSVTNNTTVTINDNAVIYQNVYGGGSLASIGPPDMGQGFEQKTPESTFDKSKSSSSNNVIINGGTIGHNESYALGYGGNVFGASRGNISNLNLGATPFLFATSIWTNVEARSGHIFGNVFGGGENGEVKRDTYVEIGGVPVRPVLSSPAPVINNNQQPEPSPAPQRQDQGNAQPQNSVNGATQGNAATESQQTRTINTNRAQ